MYTIGQLRVGNLSERRPRSARGTPLHITQLRGLGDVSRCGVLGGRDGGFRDAEIALGPFVQDVKAPGAGPSGAAAEEIFPDGLRESAVEAGFERGRPIA